MHNILLVIDPQDNKIKDLDKDDRTVFVESICNRLQYHALEENDDIFVTMDKRYADEKHPFIFEEMTKAIIDLPNVHIPIQNKHNLGSLDMVQQVIQLHRKYENEGGVKVEIIGTNTRFECLIMAMTLKTLIDKLEVEMNLSCIWGKIEESSPIMKEIGIDIITT